MDNTAQPSDAALLTRNAHKVAYAVGAKLKSNVGVMRMPLRNDCLAFEFTLGNKSAAFGQSFLDGNLAVVATRLLTDLAGASHGNKKGDARHKGERV